MVFRVFFKVIILTIFLTSSLTYGSNAVHDEYPNDINTIKLKVGVSYPSFYPFDIVYKGDGSSYEGISKDVLSILSEILNIEFDFIFLIVEMRLLMR